jgi:hypothetical protein
MDGQLAEEVWKTAPATEPFLYLGTHTPAGKQSRARLAYDESHLYVAVEAEEPDLKAVRGGMRPRDAEETWQDDGVEILLAPALGSAEYYHFIFNFSGAQYDALMGGKGLATAWNPSPDWQVAVAQGTDRWTAEVAIPFRAVGAETPLRGELWGLKVGRSLWGRGADRREDAFSAWSYSPSVSYHDPAGWGWLYFGATNLLTNGDFRSAPQPNGLPQAWSQQVVWQEGQPETGTVRQEEYEGQAVLRLHKKAEAQGSLLPRALCTVPVRGGHRYRLSASVLAKGTVELILSWRAPTGPAYLQTPFTLQGEAFEQVSAEADIPPSVTAVTVMLSFDRESTGDLRVREVSLQDLGPPVRKLDVDLIHRLQAAAASHVEMKPYDPRPGRKLSL